MADSGSSKQAPTSVGMPKALGDFLFDLYDSVTLSQLPEELDRLYKTEFPSLCQKYFAHSPWPAPPSVASECDGSPLFLSLYGELTHRYACNSPQSVRPNLHDRLEAWQVYQTCCDEILEAFNDSDTAMYLVPQWIFDLLQEFVYQFQGFCQLRSAIYASARKQGLLNAQGEVVKGGESSALLDNLTTLQANTSAWNAEAVYDYLYRFVGLGASQPKSATAAYLTVFGSIVLSRLNCLLGDYQGCLDALDVLTENTNLAITHTTPTKNPETYSSIVQECLGARISSVYHASVAQIMLKSFRPATESLNAICVDLQRGFQTGTLSRSEYNKPFDRMLSLLSLLRNSLAPQYKTDDSLKRALPKLDTDSIMNNFPKFISTDPHYGLFRQQGQALESNVLELAPAFEQLRSLLNLYHQVEWDKLGEENQKVLVAYQMVHKNSYFYVKDKTVFIPKQSKQTRWDDYFLRQMEQADQVSRVVRAIDTKV